MELCSCTHEWYNIYYFIYLLDLFYLIFFVIFLGGFADLHYPRQWTLAHVRSSEVRSEYEAIVHKMLDALDFMKTIHAEV